MISNIECGNDLLENASLVPVLFWLMSVGFVLDVSPMKYATVDFGYKGLSLMRDDFSGPFDQNVRNFRQL